LLSFSCSPPKNWEKFIQKKKSTIINLEIQILVNDTIQWCLNYITNNITVLQGDIEVKGISKYFLSSESLGHFLNSAVFITHTHKWHTHTQVTHTKKTTEGNLLRRVQSGIVHTCNSSTWEQKNGAFEAGLDYRVSSKLFWTIQQDLVFI
jgi:hypothetical protein